MNISVCHISTYEPTPCGIATFAEDVCSYTSASTNAVLIPLKYEQSDVLHDPPEITIKTMGDYTRAADWINRSGTAVVSIQHEFGIFGGAHGEFVNVLARQIRRPIVTTLHTVTRELSYERRAVLRELCNLSQAIVVLTDESRNVLVDIAAVSPEKIDVLRHGVPEVPFMFPEQCGQRNQLCGADMVFVSAGHLRKDKGYHVALEALSRFRDEGLNYAYLILGAKQPQFDGDSDYSQHLGHRIKELGLDRQVVRIERYLSRADLISYICAADVGLVTYTNSGHNSSGILPLILACGRPVVATNFEYARSIASQVNGVHLAAMNDPSSVHARIHSLATDRKRLRQAMIEVHHSMQKWAWPQIGGRYCAIFEKVAATSGH